MQSPKVELPGPSVSLPINADDLATLVMYDHYELRRIIYFMLEQDPDYSSDQSQPRNRVGGARAQLRVARMFGRLEVIYGRLRARLGLDAVCHREVSGSFGNERGAVVTGLA